MPHRSVHCDSQPRLSSRCTLDEALPAAQHLQSRRCFSARPNVEGQGFRPTGHANRRCTRTGTPIFLQVNVAAKAAGLCSREGGKPSRQLEAAAGNIHSGNAHRRRAPEGHSIFVKRKRGGESRRVWRRQRQGPPAARSGGLDGDFGQHSADGRATRPHAPLKEHAARSCSAEGESCTAPPAG